MIGVGIFLGLLTALLQAGSYLCSAGFNARHNSSWHLLLYSQLVMGVLGGVVLVFILPCRAVLAVWPEMLLMLVIWSIVLSIGQLSFFLAQTLIPSSCLASLLGLKVIVLSLIWVFGMGRKLELFQYSGVLITALAAMMINYGGGIKISWKGLLYLAGTLIFYSLADITETTLVLMLKSGRGIFFDGIVMASLCYLFLGILTLPFFLRIKWKWAEQRDSAPFGIVWLVSQMTLLGCFGLLQTLFGNMIQSTRGLMSVVLGALACKLGFKYLDVPADKRVWVRRGIAALLMIAGVIAYNAGRG